MKKLISKSFLEIVWIATLYSVFVNVVILFIARLIAPAPKTFGPYMYSSVIGLTVLGVVLAAAVFVFIKNKYKTKANKIFFYVSSIALFVSFYPDIVLPFSTAPDEFGWTPEIIVILMLMHVTTALIVINLFTKGTKGDLVKD